MKESLIIIVFTPKDAGKIQEVREHIISYFGLKNLGPSTSSLDEVDSPLIALKAGVISSSDKEHLDDYITGKEMALLIIDEVDFENDFDKNVISLTLKKIKENE